MENTKAKKLSKSTEEDDYSPDLLQAFLKDVGKYKLLTASEGLELFKRLEKGDKRAKEIIIKANLRMVISVANKYYKSQVHGVGYLDLIQEGMFGLIRATDRFDYKKGYRFSTYAMWWIRQTVARGLAEKSRTIRIPVHVIEKLNRISKAEEALQVELGRDPTNAEIGEFLELPEETINLIRRGAQIPISLDMPVTDNSEGFNEFGNILTDETVPSPHEIVSEQINKEVLEEALETLSPRSRRILEYRYGLNGQYPKTLSEIGKIFNISYERVRDIEAQALEQIRKNPAIQTLKD